MGTLASAVKAPVVVEMKGRQIELSPLDLSDFGQLERFVQYYEVEVLSHAPGVTDEELREARLRCAQNEVSLESPEFVKRLQTVSGATELIYLSAKHKHPDLDRSFFQSLPLDQIQEFGRAVNYISGFLPNSKKAASSQKKVGR